MARGPLQRNKRSSYVHPSSTAALGQAPSVSLIYELEFIAQVFSYADTSPAKFMLGMHPAYLI